MSDVYLVAMEGIDAAISESDALPDQLLKNMVRAVNKTTDWARTASSREILEQVAFPASYLSPSGGRLVVSKRATASDPEGVISGRRRPTSLARFMRGSPRTGVRVEVKPGAARFLKRAFAMKLRSGIGGDLNNIGLAVRTDGGPPPRAYKPLRINDNLWLLYGPSVNQVFDKTRDKIGPEASEYLTEEFLRLLDLDLK